MIPTEDILKTIEMVQLENLDVRAVTLGINLMCCADGDADRMVGKIRSRIHSVAENLVTCCDEVSAKYGISIVNKRLAVSKISSLLEAHGAHVCIPLARVLDEAASGVGVDIIGGYTALVQKGFSDGDRRLIDSIPEVLCHTERVCSSVNVAGTKSGINMDAVLLMGRQIKRTAELTADKDGFGAAKLVVFANIPEDNPFMAGAFLGPGEPGTVANIGVSGPGVIKRALERLLESGWRVDLGHIAEEIKRTSFRVTRVGELMGREVAKKLGVEFGVVDLSLAPTSRVGDSVGEILQTMGIVKIGAPGSTAAIALLNDAVKKGGLFASSSVGGLSGAFIPVCEDQALSNAVAEGSLTLEKLEAMTSVCSVGLDMVVVPGDVDPETISAIIADEMAIGVINNKTTAVRIIPAPGKKVGDRAVFGGLFGEGAVADVRNAGYSNRFVAYGGRIPAPLHSLKN
ncbi:MAG TPA: PFL family protein [Candidatus Hydrogenedentes bacterium]|nr:PFL family protein [Candidatus Hydrogenedentota bacterium]HQE81619.1 PFL family protein [Candidatus Hydrogenedentota bacterium]HQH52821.1 PFL family protein [Candidatus Hydrogenedentota bacterium]HQM48052.1 PFL family protein [Candidatus Hydrogenedentota bacterium]